MSKKVSVLLLSLGLSVQALLPAPSSASHTVPATKAASETTLPLTDFADIVVDDANEQVFVSGGPENDSVVVLDYEGTILDTIDDVPGAAGMLLKDGELYIALSDSDKIEVVNSGTLEHVRSYTIPAEGGVHRVISAGGFLWVAAGDQQQCNSTVLYRLDPSNGNVTTALGPGAGRCPLLLAGPPGSGVIYMSDGHTSDIVYKLSIVDGALTIADSAEMPVYAMALTDDGKELYVAGGVMKVLDTETMSPIASYPKGSAAVALSSDASRVIAGPTDYYGNDAFVYRRDSVEPIYVHDAGAELVLEPDGLALTSDDRLMFLVLGDYFDKTVFQVADDPTRMPANLVFRPTSEIRYGSRVALEGRLNFPLDDESPEGKKVALTASPVGRPPVALGKVTVQDDGSFSLVRRPRVTTTYRATFNGGSSHRDDRVDRVVSVAPVVQNNLEGFHGINRGVRIFAWRSTVIVNARVNPAHSGAPVEVSVNEKGSGGWSQVAEKDAVLDGEGRASVSFDARTFLPANVVHQVRVYFPGDEDHASTLSGPRRFVIRSR